MRTRARFRRAAGTQLDRLAHQRPLRFLGILAAGFLALQALFFVGVVGAQLVAPNHRIAHNLDRAIDDGTMPTTNYAVTPYGTRTEGFTVCNTDTTGLGTTPGRGPVANAIAAGTLGPCQDAIPKIRHWATSAGARAPAMRYFRYWHGYTVVTRPALAWLGLTQCHVVVAILLGAGLVALAAVTRRLTGTWWAPALLLGPLLTTTDFVLLASYDERGVSMAVALGAAAAVGAAVRRAPAWQVAAAACFVAGALFVYVDQFTTPPLAWGLASALATVAALAAPAAGSWRATTRVSAAALVGWPVGWAATWAAKWVIAIPVEGFHQVVGNVVDQARFRLGGQAPTATAGHTGTDAFAAGLVKSWHYWTGHDPASPPTHPPFVGQWAIAVVVLAVLALASVQLRRRLRPRWSGLLLVVPAALTPLWLLALNGHTLIHYWLVYRSFPVALGLLALAVLSVVRGGDAGAGQSRASTPGRRARVTATRAASSPSGG